MKKGAITFVFLLLAMSSFGLSKEAQKKLDELRGITHVASAPTTVRKFPNGTWFPDTFYSGENDFKTYEDRQKFWSCYKDPTSVGLLRMAVSLALPNTRCKLAALEKLNAYLKSGDPWKTTDFDVNEEKTGSVRYASSTSSVDRSASIPQRTSNVHERNSTVEAPGTTVEPQIFVGKRGGIYHYSKSGKKVYHRRR